MSVQEVRYTVLGLVARGGFGEVYKARMEAPGGFAKDVAVKLLKPGMDQADTVRRLRDEARILAMIRDRALTSVDPPALLNGRWAMVMEYVPGLTLRSLRERGPLPPAVVAAVGAEVARCLQKCHAFPGPDGAPLELLHRDLKPGNVMLTADGDVKLLDFGLARARFEAREAESVSGLGGTAGYIPPERLFGVDCPAGDLFSLGVMLQVLLLGVGARELVNAEKATARLRSAGVPEPLVDLAARLRADEPEERPSHAEVMDVCRAVAATGPALDVWAREHVQEPTLAGSDLSGASLAGSGGEEPSQTTGMSRSTVLVAAGGIGMTTVLVSALVGLFVVGLVGGMLFLAPRPPEPVTIEPEPVVAAVPAPPEPAEPVDPPAPVAAAVTPHPAPKPVLPAPVVAPAPVAPDEPVVPPEPVVETPEVPSVRVDLLCTSGTARVRVDGGPPVATPAVGQAVSRGMHEIRYEGACRGSGRFLFGGRRGCVGVTATADALVATGCR
ncbi:MAG: serine/threonine protein kinase [Alphaproteobacteria bacterium]|nr:serine/threonine protein kinase [Alphaproteobacteria bacterium]